MALLSVAAMAQNKFAHINLSEVVQLMPEMDSARDAIEAAQQETQDTYAAMIEEFQSKYQQYEQKSSTWTASVKQSKEQELTQIQQRIQDFEQSASSELQYLQQQLMAPIYAKAQDALTEIAKKGGYVFVMDASQVLYVDPSQSDDITPAVRKAVGIAEDRTIEQLQAELQARQAAMQN